MPPVEFNIHLLSPPLSPSARSRCVAPCHLGDYTHQFAFQWLFAKERAWFFLVCMPGIRDVRISDVDDDAVSFTFCVFCWCFSWDMHCRQEEKRGGRSHTWFFLHFFYFLVHDSHWSNVKHESRVGKKKDSIKLVVVELWLDITKDGCSVALSQLPLRRKKVKACCFQLG